MVQSGIIPKKQTNMVEIKMKKSFKKSCNDMTELIESCWDENNPNDGMTFDERLQKAIAGLTGTDRKVMGKVLCW